MDDLINTINQLLLQLDTKHTSNLKFTILKVKP